MLGDLSELKDVLEEDDNAAGSTTEGSISPSWMFSASVGSEHGPIGSDSRAVVQLSKTVLQELGGGSVYSCERSSVLSGDAESTQVKPCVPLVPSEVSDFP